MVVAVVTVALTRAVGDESSVGKRRVFLLKELILRLNVIQQSTPYPVHDFRGKRVSSLPWLQIPPPRTHTRLGLFCSLQLISNGQYHYICDHRVKNCFSVRFCGNFSF